MEVVFEILIVLLSIGIVYFCISQVVKLVRDIKNKKKNKNDGKGGTSK